MTRGPHGREKGVFFEQIRKGRLEDPYIPRKGFEEPTICPSCNAIYFKKKWNFDENLFKKVEKDKNVNHLKCPACRKIEDHYPMGIIRLAGNFVSEHREEIVNLLHSEEKRAMEKNPLERIMKIEKGDGGIYAETTSDSLALRIGRVLSRAYKGKSDYKFRYGDKFVMVEWRRD